MSTLEPEFKKYVSAESWLDDGEYENSISEANRGGG